MKDVNDSWEGKDSQAKKRKWWGEWPLFTQLRTTVREEPLTHMGCILYTYWWSNHLKYCTSNSHMNQDMKRHSHGGSSKVNEKRKKQVYKTWRYVNWRKLGNLHYSEYQLVWSSKGHKVNYYCALRYLPALLTLGSYIFFPNKLLPSLIQILD